MWRRRPKIRLECVADKGYHSRLRLEGARRRPLEEPDLRALKQKGFANAGTEMMRRRRAVTNNRTRLLSGVAREAFKLRAEIVERSFAHEPRSRRYAPDLASGLASLRAQESACFTSPATTYRC